MLICDIFSWYDTAVHRGSCYGIWYILKLLLSNFLDADIVYTSHIYESDALSANKERVRVIYLILHQYIDMPAG